MKTIRKVSNDGNITWYEFREVQYFFEPHYEEWYCMDLLFENEESIREYINQLKDQ